MSYFPSLSLCMCVCICRLDDSAECHSSGTLQLGEGNISHWLGSWHVSSRVVLAPTASSAHHFAWSFFFFFLQLALGINSSPCAHKVCNVQTEPPPQLHSCFLTWCFLSVKEGLLFVCSCFLRQGLPGTLYVDYPGLKLTESLLPQFPQFWNCRNEPHVQLLYSFWNAHTLSDSREVPSSGACSRACRNIYICVGWYNSH